MFESHSQAIYELLRERALVSPEQLGALQEEHRATGKSLAVLALEQDAVSEPALLRSIAESLGCGSVTDLPTALPAAVTNLLPAHLGRTYTVIPLRGDERHLELLAADPFNNQTVEDLTFALGRDVRLLVASPARVEALVRQHYGQDELTLDELLRGLDVLPPAPNDTAELSARELEALAGHAPIVRFVNLVLEQAVRDHASDIHFEPFETEFRIRYRVDGALYEMTPPPKTLALPITSRIKVLADLNIAERRVPQDGRIRLTLAGRAVDLRVSTLPTQFGESVVLRVLDASALRLDLTQLGLRDDVLSGIDEIIHRPNGILIVTGPTGSGKTTTLYSALRVISTPALKVLTAEDPVEYEVEGIMQVPVNPAVGLTFAAALRAFLRQDPDVIMVGEIRDLETAQIAIQASLTGHLVLSTLHTNDAAGAITRLIDMGVEPFLVASTLEAVLAQRLVRRICPQCRVTSEPTAALLAQLGLKHDGTLLTPRPTPARSPGRESVRFHAGRGCVACGNTGYRGRQGIFEWLRVTDAVRELIAVSAPSQVIRRQAIEEGMGTLRDDGLRAIFGGLTTVDEVVKSA